METDLWPWDSLHASFTWRTRFSLREKETSREAKKKKVLDYL